MPTYSYLCEGCGKSFELEQRISEDPIKKCVLCGESKARRQIVSGNFILKGGGWYSDGYGSSKKSAKTEASSNSPSNSKSEPTTKSDKSEGSSTKSESKSEGKSDSSAAKGGESKVSAAE